VISHACVLPSNQRVYEYVGDDIDVSLVVPRVWRDELRPSHYAARADTGWRGEFIPVRTWGVGRPQRHMAVAMVGRRLAALRPNFVVIEEEPFSVSALLWAHAAHRRSIPYAVQVAETLPRRLPRPVDGLCRRVLTHASFVLARSPGALARAREWGYVGPDTLVPHSIDVTDGPTLSPRGVVGFVGRLVPAKGIDDLLRAISGRADLSLAVAGDGPERDTVAALGDRVQMRGTLAPAAMSAFYDSISVLAVPSRTTPTWSEQFGRVIVEAQERARPVVAYDSGEIPWVASLTAAEVVTEGDVSALAEALARFAISASSADDVGRRGRELATQHFSHAVVGGAIGDLVRSAARH
jgi:glycosyltransferase involved in cell wall biosynthesis